MQCLLAATKGAYNQLKISCMIMGVFWKISYNMLSTFSLQIRKLSQTVFKYVKVIYLIVDRYIYNHCLQRRSQDQSWYIKILPSCSIR